MPTYIESADIAYKGDKFFEGLLLEAQRYKDVTFDAIKI